MSVGGWIRRQCATLSRSVVCRYKRSRLSFRTWLFGQPPRVGHTYYDRLTDERVFICSIGTTRIQVTRDGSQNIANADSVSKSMVYTALALDLLEHDATCPQCGGP